MKGLVPDGPAQAEHAVAVTALRWDLVYGCAHAHLLRGRLTAFLLLGRLGLALGLFLSLFLALADGDLLAKRLQVERLTEAALIDV